MDWHCLEDVHGLVAVPAVWRARLRADYDVFNDAFLRKRREPARSVPCPHGCGCAHEVVRHEDGRLKGVCRCEPWNCDDLALLPEDVTLWELNTGKFGREVAKAFHLHAREPKLGMRGATQIAAFGNAALPVVLALCEDADALHRALLELASRLPERFIVLTPTSRWWGGDSLELLKRHRARVFDLESQLTLLAGGALAARTSGQDLFSPLLPAVEEAMTKSEAARVFALMKSLDDGPKVRKAPRMFVFRRLVLEQRSQESVARECDCSEALISLRVREIETRMKRSLDVLQALMVSQVEMKASDEDEERSGRADRISSADEEDEEGEREGD